MYQEGRLSDKAFVNKKGDLKVEKDLIENAQIEAKRNFVRLGWAILAMTIGLMFIGPTIMGILAGAFPDFAQGPWFMWVNVGVSFYCIGVPIFYVMTRNIPSGPKGEKKTMSVKEFMTIFLISMAAVYLFNILGNVVNLLLGVIVGGEISNPLIGALDGASILATFIFVGILSPIFEELVFRGIMLDKLRLYGDKTAIWFTALIFGLFHGNVSQFFYALVLGLFLGYIATKTNTIKHTIILHIVINILGSIIMPAIVFTENELLVGGVGIVLVAVIITGIILYVKNIKKVELEPAQIVVEPSEKKRALYFNIGIIIYYIMCAYMFISVILM